MFKAARACVSARNSREGGEVMGAEGLEKLIKLEEKRAETVRKELEKIAKEEEKLAEKRKELLEESLEDIKDFFKEQEKSCAGASSMKGTRLAR